MNLNYRRKNMNNCYKTFDSINANNLKILDKFFEKVAEKYGAEYYHIPAMIDADVLKKCGYLSSFPHHLTLASYIDPKQYDELAIEGKMDASYVRNSNMYFTPSACLHFYPMLEGKKIDKKVITTRARVYRYEENRFDGNCRLWDFTVREIVFVGENKFVIESLKSFEEITIKLIEKIGLAGSIVRSHDYFYPSVQNNFKSRLQFSNSLKNELRVTINQKEVAIASFNTHGYHFSKPFNFDNSGTTVSGCVGYGLERWIAALSEYGIILNYEELKDLI